MASQTAGGRAAGIGRSTGLPLGSPQPTGAPRSPAGAGPPPQNTPTHAALRIMGYDVRNVPS